jgi:thiosulfate/3-mercaptopyruvate sulfurtransferase
MLDARFEKYYHKGHIPTSKSLSLLEVMDENYCFKPADEMRKIFQSRGIANPDKDEIILTCQRGITACILDTALRTLGNPNTSVYDGSLEEWSIKTGGEPPKE